MYLQRFKTQDEEEKVYNWRWNQRMGNSSGKSKENMSAAGLLILAQGRWNKSVLAQNTTRHSA